MKNQVPKSSFELRMEVRGGGVELINVISDASDDKNQLMKLEVGSTVKYLYVSSSHVFLASRIDRETYCRQRTAWILFESCDDDRGTVFCK